MTIAYLLFLILPLVMIAAGISDLISYRIPNILSLILVIMFFPFAIVAGIPLYEIGIHVGLACIVLTVGFLLFNAGLLGAGDAKLLAASSLWIAGWDLFTYLIIISIAGGVLALGILIWRRMPMPEAILNFRWIRQIYTPVTKGRDVPYAVAMMVGFLWIMPHLKIMELAAS